MSDNAYRERLLASVGGDFSRFVGWFSQRTFSPDRQAQRALDDWAAHIGKVAGDLADVGATPDQVEQWVAGCIKRWAAFQAAGSRTINWMITGPARFPVARNQKRLDIEHKRLEELLAYANGSAEWFRRQGRRAERAALSEQAATVAHSETEICGIRMVENTTLDRVQLIFPGKPDPETIKDLKKAAFRWSPREGAWQRQLTRNGIWAARGILAGIAADAEV